MTKRHRSILESREIAIDCVFWLIVFLLAALAMQLLSFPSSNGDRQAIVSDTFDTPIAAGEVGGTYSTGGQLRTVTDAESKASVADGKLSFSGGMSVPAAGNPGVWLPAVTRASGLTVRGTFNQSATTTVGAFGFDADTSGTVSAGFSTAASGVLNFTDSAARNIGSYAAATDYPMAVQAGVSKWFAYLSESGIWKLKYISFLNVSDATIYPVLSGNTAAITLDDLDVRIRPLPVPLASDSFNRADGALGSTDGLGHAEANGGNGKVWTIREGTWYIASNVAQATDKVTYEPIVTLNATTPNVIVLGSITAYSQGVGLIVRYVNYLNYAQYRYYDRELQMVKFINGNYTKTGYAAGDYNNPHALMLIADGTRFAAYWKGKYMFACVISDSVFQSSSHVGMLSLKAVNSIDNFCVYGVGNEGQYRYMGDRR